MRKFLIPMSMLALLLAAPTASGHPERTTFFPDHTKGERPSYPTTGEILTVCKPDSAKRIAQIWKGKGPKTTRTRELRLKQVARCGFRDIQAAVDAATSGDRIRIFPGVYTEEPSRKVPLNDPKCALDDPKYWEPTNDGHGENGKVPTYQFHWDCKNSRNLIQIMGDDPKDPDRVCDQKCGLLLEGVGRKPEDVLVVGDRLKRDVIRADRADGIYIKGIAVEQGSFNGLDVVETNGFVIQSVVGRYNHNYGILTFTSDNGLYEFIDAYGNGDSGIYPGSGPEGHCQRYGIEIRYSKSHDNVLGQSGTAGNGTWAHHSEWYDNGTGIVNDSFASGHPGMPQDCSKWEDNKVYSNNQNFFDEGNQGYCKDTPFEKRPREHVCPQFQSPVGVGFAFYGANGNIIRRNQVWDNWRSGYRLFWVPAIIRGEVPPEDVKRQFDTSNQNKITENTFGRAPNGSAAPNGTDVYWDEQGIGNCWEANRGLGEGGAITSNPSVLPDCARGSKNPIGNPAKLALEATCSTWDPEDNPDPPACTWFDTPKKPGAPDASGTPGSTTGPDDPARPTVRLPGLPPLPTLPRR